MTLALPALDIDRDDARKTHAKMMGGWLVDLAAFPGADKVGIVENWIVGASRRMYELARINPQESERWFLVAKELAAIIAFCAPMRLAHEIGKR